MDKIYLAALQMISGIGTARLKGLLSYFGTAEQVWLAKKRELFLSGYLNETIYNKLLIQREKIDIYTLASDWQNKGIRVCSYNEPEYPKLLFNIVDAPRILFYRGRLPNTEQLIAIVGARKATAYGKNAAQSLAAELSEAGVWIVSGAARGIDTAAHQGALLSGRTIAVLGCGVDVSYPPENKKLISQIAERGAVISEYAPGTPAQPGHFPARNRIISGLSKGVIVVEAAERSGALITADFALEEGRDVFAVPGSIFSLSSRGTHRLIKQGAKLIDCAADLLEEYDIPADKEERKEIELTAEETMIYEILTYEEPLGIEEIIMKTKLSPAAITYILLQFELRGLVTVHNGASYLRCAKEGVK